MPDNRLIVVSLLLSTVNKIEDDLKYMRDQSDRPVQIGINRALEAIFPLRDRLHDLDRLLERP